MTSLNNLSVTEFLHDRMTAPKIPLSALELGESNYEVTGKLD